MRVFVAGATGVIGHRAVARLVAAGHEVTGVARTAEKDALLRSLGAAPVRVSLFDPAALAAAVAGHDAVVNLATHIPRVADMPRMSAWAENEKLRREASGYLVDAALAAHATVFVQESLAFVYGEHGDTVIDGTTTPFGDGPFNEAVQIAEANVARFTAAGGRGVVLRFGRFYAADSDQAATMVNMARRGFAVDVGPGASYAPMINADDAAAAVVAALAAPAGVYDVVDEPTTREEQRDALAAAVGRRRLWSPPPGMAPRTASHLAASQRVSNARFRAASGWQPGAPTVREGFRQLVRELRVEPALPVRDRLLLWVLVISAFGVGVQAAFFPRSFYDDFPFGRGWVAMDGRYNEHLVRDVGALNLALLVLTIGALWVGTRAIVRIAALSWLVYSIPHWVYHLRHLSMPMSGAEKVAVMVSLSVPVLAALVLLFDRMRPKPVAIDLRDDDLPMNLTAVSARCPARPLPPEGSLRRSSSGPPPTP